MNDERHPRRFWPSAVLVTAAFALVLAGCATSENAAAPTPSLNVPQPTLGSRAVGDQCDDPTGDIQDSVRSAGTLADPPGIDIVHAEAKLVDDTALNVVFQTAGPIESATDPLFIVLQGDTSQAINQSFELRAQAKAGRWGVTLITFANNRENPGKDLGVPVTVGGNQLSYSVAKSSLPTIATILWQFGSSAGISANNRLIDDCEPFAAKPNATGPAATSPSGTAPTTTVPPTIGTVGQPVTATNGSKVTVKTIDNPAKPTRQMSAEPIPQDQLAAIQVEVCGGPPGSQPVGEAQFTVQTAGPNAEGRSFDPWGVDDYSNEPRFTLQATLRSGTCESGWMNFEIPKDAQITSVTYDAGGKKVGPYVVINNG